MKPPKFHELSLRAQKRLLDVTQVDSQIYAEMVLRWRELVRQQGPSFDEEVREFRSKQKALEMSCKSEPKHPACKWYSLDDLSLFRLVQDGYASPVPFV